MTKLFQDTYDASKHISTDGYTIFCHGGDGTLLRAIANYSHFDLPFFGVAGGTANYMMNTSPHVSTQAITKTFDKIHVEVSTDEGTFIANAFQDVILGSFNGWINFDCHHNSDILGQFNGSGLIISTPQGSTGANKNNGGVVLPLSSRSWAISGVTCDKRIHYVIARENLQIDVSARAPISLAIDGTHKVFHNVKSIQVSLHKTSQTQVIFNDYHTFTKKRRQ